jgi:type IV pilus assembly protein PilV
MSTPARRRARERGTTILEAMIALVILLVGLLGMARLQIYGMGATQGSRAQTVASELAVELANGLALLAPDDARLTGSSSGPPDYAAPATFGPLIPLGVPSSGVHVYDDGSPVPATRPDALLERDPTDPSQPVYRRRWTVWDQTVTGSGAAAKLVAVSVIWRERSLPNPRELVVYVHSDVRGGFMANLNAFR